MLRGVREIARFRIVYIRDIYYFNTNIGATLSWIVKLRSAAKRRRIGLIIA